MISPHSSSSWAPVSMQDREEIIIGLTSFVIMWVSRGCELWALKDYIKGENSDVNTSVINSSIQRKGDKI